MWTVDLSLLLLLTTLLYLPQNSTTLTFSPPPAMAAVRQSRVRCEFLVDFASRLFLCSRTRWCLCDICLGMEDIPAVKVSQDCRLLSMQ
ncbi:uncharacterized protein EV420DRAFT_1591257 [Desarmillaria tabescens]|uniref:Secreted protein n=1 Tax=Armillaria tabescens TaxID=1929756 RepID=A0AA39J4K9_ARMTA|nr:uncharacterized protein EV420DRAFT_1591257 [Desarmillaria tabescens]KAK0436045.1 hypothetical protein EV420DRAFT_1591257 [Desarmillaria tabescens]